MVSFTFIIVDFYYITMVYIITFTVVTTFSVNLYYINDWYYNLHYIFTELNALIIFSGDSVLFSLLFLLHTLGYSGKYWPICRWNFRESKPEILIQWKALAPEKNTCSCVIEFRAQITQKEEVPTLLYYHPLI